MGTEFHALGIAYRPNKSSRGYVVVRFTVQGNKVIAQELVSPEPEPINFAASRLKTECAKLLQVAKEDAELALSPKADRP
jgi:hypothetical protein